MINCIVLQCQCRNCSTVTVWRSSWASWLPSAGFEAVLPGLEQWIQLHKVWNVIRILNVLHLQNLSACLQRAVQPERFFFYPRQSIDRLVPCLFLLSKSKPRLHPFPMGLMLLGHCQKYGQYNKKIKFSTSITFLIFLLKYQCNFLII